MPVFFAINDADAGDERTRTASTRDSCPVDGRLYLHRIYPCPAGAALFHPHPWPCAIRVLSGRYEMGMGAGQSDPVIGSRLVANGAIDYEMTEPDAWHYVRPIAVPALTVMVTGAPWDRPSPRPEHPLDPLSREQRDALREDIRIALEPRK